jgi:hypothetical protein
MRCVPDIAADADLTFQVFHYVGPVYGSFAGTSLSAPIIAGYLAAIGCKSFVTPWLYRAPSSCFRDITVGNNSVAGKKGTANNPLSQTQSLQQREFRRGWNSVGSEFRLPPPHIMEDEFCGAYCDVWADLNVRVAAAQRGEECMICLENLETYDVMEIC